MLFFVLLCFNFSLRRKCATCSMPPPSRTFCPESTLKVYKGVGSAKYVAEKKTRLLVYLFVGSEQSVLVCCVSCRGRASGGEDEKAGSQVRPSPPCASNREVGNATGEINMNVFKKADRWGTNYLCVFRIKLVCPP